MVGKVFAKGIQQRLQKAVEDVVLACGFRCNCGCTDMIFCAHQLIEKIIEQAFRLSIDLKKAYDSVPRAAMWLVLAKDGVPDVMISVIRST